MVDMQDLEERLGPTSPITQAEADALRSRMQTLLHTLHRYEHQMATMETEIQTLRSKVEDSDELRSQFRSFSSTLNDVRTQITHMEERLRQAEMYTRVY